MSQRVIPLVKHYYTIILVAAWALPPLHFTLLWSFPLFSAPFHFFVPWKLADIEDMKRCNTVGLMVRGSSQLTTQHAGLLMSMECYVGGQSDSQVCRLPPPPINQWLLYLRASPFATLYVGKCSGQWIMHAFEYEFWTSTDFAILSRLQQGLLYLFHNAYFP